MAFTVIDALAGTTRVDGDERTVDQRRADAFATCSPAILHRQATPDGTPLPRRHGQAVTIGVTVAATTLAGLDENPGYLDSYGPIPAGMARELAQDGTWRRLLTDPDRVGRRGRDGRLPAGGGPDPDGHRPGRDLHVPRVSTTRHPLRPRPHRTLRPRPRPRRRRPARTNLHALCRHHHEAKTKKHWNVHRNPTTGVTWWTSPDGLTYARHPTPVLIDPSALVCPPPGRHPTSANQDDDDPPPF